jgi:septal ring factor EnvC (AmiA/AmiB activator)
VNNKSGEGEKKVIHFPQDESLFEEVHSRLLDELKPAGETETAMVERIARSWAELQRARQRETLVIEAHMDELKRTSPEPITNERALALVFLHHLDELEALQKKEMAIENLWYRTRHALEREQNRRRKREKAAAASAAKQTKAKRKPRSTGGLHIVQKKDPAP